MDLLANTDISTLPRLEQDLATSKVADPAAKLERQRIKERTARDRADAKANGVKFGRKPKLTPDQKREAIKRRDRECETLRSIGRSYNVSAATISRLAP
jgi:DNA invertase Pin-like site-specific DNA recombinase